MKPNISVVVVALNEEKLIGQCMRSILSQDYQKDMFEVIVIDNGSTDQTASVCENLGVNVFPYTKRQGCGPARAFGAQKARGEIIVFTDADCTVPVDWLKRIEVLLKNPHTQMLTGNGIPVDKTSLTVLVFRFYDIFYRINYFFQKPLVWGYCMALKRSAYLATGGFDETLLSSEDWDLGLRVRDSFGKNSVIYVPTLQVHTSVRKQKNARILWRYGINGIRNYTDLVILGKRRAVPVFNIR